MDRRWSGRVSCLAMAALAVVGCGASDNAGQGKAAATAVSGGAGSETGGDRAPRALRLNAGGSTFVYPLMSKWASAYQKDAGVEINYQSIGSGGGIQKMTAKEFEFGCSDAPLNDEQLAKAGKVGGDVVHVPLAMGAVALVYNLEGVDKQLRLSGQLIADIFQRKIKKWNDPRIAESNSGIGVKLPDLEIVVVHRSDGSGTTHIFADFLAKVSASWKESVGVSTSLRWADDTVGAKGNEGVAGQVRLNPGAIGYVELTYALQNKMKYAAVRNESGEFVTPNLESVTAAARNRIGEIPSDLRYSLTNAPGVDSYPISGTVWSVSYVGMGGAQGKAVADFLRWAIREDGGQKYCAELHYAALPRELAERIEPVIARMEGSL
ncbi:MAG: phosphate ABC transporter substrate-binding protein PstS [Planctomycetes bacterium]|nr:phosphate ABC transporter substrate-binding protein PstS [Planctomycetota bacterium]